MSLADLVALVPPPADPQHARGDWAAVEAALGTPLPPDFKALTERYGAGGFVDELHPLTPFWAACPMTARAVALQDDTQAWFPAPGGLLLWATGASGQRLAWRTGGAPDTWRTTVLVPRDDASEDHDLDATGLLAAWLAGRLPRSLLGAPPTDAGAAPWFEPTIERVHVTVHLDPASKQATPHDARLARLLAALADHGPIAARGRFRGAGGAAQDHLAVGALRLTYDTAYGHNLRVGYPPADEPAARAAAQAAVAALGATVTRVMHNDGRPAWITAPAP